MPRLLHDTRLLHDSSDIVQIPINSVNAISVTPSIKINAGNLNVELPDTIPAATYSTIEMISPLCMIIA